MRKATEEALRRLAARLEAESRIVLGAHVDPDGDAIGSLCGLGMALVASGRDVYVALADDGPPPITYRRVPGFELLSPASSAPDWPAFVALDVPVRGRLGALEEGAARAGFLVRVDHHPEGEVFGGYDVADEEAPATAALVWRLLAVMGLQADAGIAEALYVGLVTDTGRFQYSNATPEAHAMAAEMLEAGVRPESVFRYVYDTRRLPALRLAARVAERVRFELDGALAWSTVADEDLKGLGALPEETENLIDELRSIEGVEVALMLKVRPDGLKGSLRAKGPVDVAAVAKALGGGGHREAAGFPFDGRPEDVVVRVRDLVAEQLSASTGAASDPAEGSR